jgi:dienelactone hydrolase
VIDLTGGVGGYSTAAQVLGALYENALGEAVPSRQQGLHSVRSHECHRPRRCELPPFLTSFVSDGGNTDMSRAKKQFLSLVFGIAALSCGAVTAAFAGGDDSLNPNLVPPAPLHEDVRMLQGDPARAVRLQVTIFTPDGAGPFPLAVLAHGATEGKQRPQNMPRYRYTYSSDYFLSRGYAVAMPMMRGFSGSGGSPINHRCNLAALGFDDARDIAAVISDFGHDAKIDTRKVVAAGQSFGGWNTLALGALHQPNIVGLVNFVGGTRTSGCTNRKDADRALVDGAGVFGGSTTVPSIWFYGDNDKYFPVPVWRAMYRRYTETGGKAELVAFGQFQSDSHQLLSALRGLPIWTGKVDAYLARVGMPSREIYPVYMPVATPLPGHFAALGDVQALPNAAQRTQEAYRSFLKEPVPRAFVLSDDGQSVDSYGGFDPLGRALKICHQYGISCFPYAVDDDVVWESAKPFAAIDDASAVPYINDQARMAYQQFLSLPTPRAFIIAPDGAWASAEGPAASLHAMEYCKSQHYYCAVYAMDKAVVWQASSN